MKLWEFYRALLHPLSGKTQSKLTWYGVRPASKSVVFCRSTVKLSPQSTMETTQSLGVACERIFMGSWITRSSRRVGWEATDSLSRSRALIVTASVWVPVVAINPIEHLTWTRPLIISHLIWEKWTMFIVYNEMLLYVANCAKALLGI